jgi:hypothetical protein
MSIIKNPFAKRGFLGGSRRTLLLFGFGLAFISSSPDSTEGGEGGARVTGVVPIAFEMESNGRSGRETGKDGLRRGGRAVDIVFGAARAWADWVFEIVGARACLVGKGINTGDEWDSWSVLEPLDSWSDASSWKRNPEEDEADFVEEEEANEGPEESGEWVSAGVIGDKLDDESLLVLVQRSLLLLDGSYDDWGAFAEVLSGGKREVTAEANVWR